MLMPVMSESLRRAESSGRFLKLTVTTGARLRLLIQSSGRVRCRVVICAACRTRVDGVNHCHACLRKLARPPKQPTTARVVGVATSVLLLGLAWLLIGGALWLAQGRLAP